MSCRSKDAIVWTFSFNIRFWQRNIWNLLSSSNIDALMRSGLEKPPKNVAWRYLVDDVSFLRSVLGSSSNLLAYLSDVL